MDTLYEPHVVYGHLKQLADRRLMDITNWNVEITNRGEGSKTVNMMSIEEFKKNMNIRRYVAVSAMDKPERQRRNGIKVQTLFIIFEVGNFDKTQPFKNLIEKIKHNDGYIMDIYTLSRDDIGVHIRNAISGLSTKNIRISPMKYDVLLLEVPRHVNAPQIRPLSKEEEEQFLNDTNIVKTSLQVTHINDPGVFWTYAEIGDIVEESHLSENVGIEVLYKFVIA
jgi:DNA-directed RNA polymerase subunit H (RpoH/RPB5)